MNFLELLLIACIVVITVCTTLVFVFSVDKDLPRVPPILPGLILLFFIIFIGHLGEHYESVIVTKIGNGTHKPVISKIELDAAGDTISVQWQLTPNE